MHTFFWLHLSINAADCRLILLDRNTFDDLDILVLV